jgi:hypothetical protein
MSRYVFHSRKFEQEDNNTKRPYEVKSYELVMPAIPPLPWTSNSSHFTDRRNEGAKLDGVHVFVPSD